MFTWNQKKRKKEKKRITKCKTLSNNKYIQFNLENLIYCINYTLLENNRIILGKI